MMNTEKYKSKYPDAHTVYRGWKLKDGKIVFDANGKPVEAIVFAVEEKKPVEELKNPIPEKLGAIPTDVVEIPRIKANPPIGEKGKKLPKKKQVVDPRDLQLKHRPIFGGLSVGHPDITVGTIGSVVFMRKGVLDKVPGRSTMVYGAALATEELSFWQRLIRWILGLFGYNDDVIDIPGGTGGNETEVIPLIMSNNHVIANENNALIGDPIIQPGDCDGGIQPNDVIGHLVAYTPVDERMNYLDIAFATIDVPYEARIEGIPIVNTQTRIPAIGDIVQKTGRTTGHRYGKVIGLDATSDIEYDRGICQFIDQIIIQDIVGEDYFCDGGDSGSLILDLDGHPVGLLFAGGGDITLANKMSRIKEDYPIYFSQNDVV